MAAKVLVLENKPDATIGKEGVCTIRSLGPPISYNVAPSRRVFSHFKDTMKFSLLIGFSHGFAFEFDAVGSVHDPVEDVIGDGLFAYDVVPGGDRELGCDQGGFPAVPLPLDCHRPVRMLSAFRLAFGV